MTTPKKPKKIPRLVTGIRDVLLVSVDHKHKRMQVIKRKNNNYTPGVFTLFGSQLGPLGLLGER